VLLSITGPDRAAAPVRPLVAGPMARSIGSPNDGRLDGGAQLVESAYIRVVPFYAESQARWGLPALVGLVDRAARRVAHRFASAVLSVGDLSRRGGGELSRHHSHESGRDADIGFYLRGPDDKPVLAEQFLAIGANGKAVAAPTVTFDDARNWALVEALIDDPEARVSYIFIASHLRARLLRFAERTGVAPTLRERAANLMVQPHRALPHDDHFHVRIACPGAQQATCVEDAVVRAPRARPALAEVRRRQGTEPATPPGSATLPDASNRPRAASPDRVSVAPAALAR
jgi:penicillin-insensitive murein endopeptidase